MVGLLSSLLILGMQEPLWSYEPPEALLHMEAYRAALHTGVVESSYERLNDRAQYEGFRRVFHCQTNMVAGEDVISVNRGDEEGIVRRKIDGEPAAHATDLFYGLRRGDEIWTHRETDYEAHLRSARAGVIGADIRTLGVMYGHCYGGLERTLWRDPVQQPSARKYRSSVEDGLHIVTAEADVGTIRWWIDPAKGWSPVRVALYRDDGELLAQSRSVLKQLDGVWFPEAVQYYEKGHRDGREARITIQVLSAEFNRPEHPTAFTPEDIGIVPSHTTVIKHDDADAEIAFGFYDSEGDDFMTPEQIAAKRLARAMVASSVRPDDAGPQQPKWTRTEFETAWEAYTRRFIEKYGLDDEQTQKAWTICRNCQQRAHDYVTSRRSRFQRLEAALAKAQAADPATRSRQVKQIKGELAGLMRPVEEIFEAQFKPRLEKLPTRAQRAAADKVAEP